MADLSPLAREVSAGLSDGNNGAIGASFGEPVPGFDSGSERDNRIKEWGIAVGLAYAIVSHEEPFASRASLEQLAGEVAREAFFDHRPECRPKEEVTD
jgi:hypothetical protein